MSSFSSRRGLVTTSALALIAAPLTLVASPAQAAPVDITIVGTNDFHGRLLPDRGIPGAAEYAGAVEQLRTDNPNTLFAAAGDLIGATTFESFINQDKPTIDVLNEMGLDVSAVGNHELDKGYDDLVNRVMAPDHEHGGAEWEYIAANIDEPGDADEIAPSWTQDVGGVTVGFVGAVTEALPSLVSPGGIEGLTVTDIVDATNAEADALRTAGADLVVLLVHEGASTTDCDAMDDDPSSAFGSIVTGVDSDVDAIISGHTHLPYDCDLPVPGGVGTRPVVSAGQYGSHLNKLDFAVDDVTGEVASVTSEILNLNTGTYPTDADVQAIVDAAVEAAEAPGSVPLGEVAEAFKRAQWLVPDEGGQFNRVENRGGESTLGNLVAEVQRWATRSQERGGAQIAFMNPGGLRTDMEQGTVTYREAANVQPFANTLVNMDMTGRQIRSVLEEQWQPEGASRPFLRLGTSRGFEYSYNPRAEAGQRIGAMWLRGERVWPREVYSVTANAFLASGGDNFPTFTEAADQRDTGMVDLQAMVDYMAAHASDRALPVRYDQHAVGVRMPRGNAVARGGRLVVKVSSLAMTALGDLKDRRVQLKIGRATIDGSRVDNRLSRGETGDEGGFDEAGHTRLAGKLPPRFKRGAHVVRIVGNRTGTAVAVPIRIVKRK